MGNRGGRDRVRSGFEGALFYDVHFAEETGAWTDLILLTEGPILPSKVVFIYLQCIKWNVILMKQYWMQREMNATLVGKRGTLN